MILSNTLSGNEMLCVGHIWIMRTPTQEDCMCTRRWFCLLKVSHMISICCKIQQYSSIPFLYICALQKIAHPEHAQTYIWNVQMLDVFDDHILDDRNSKRIHVLRDRSVSYRNQDLKYWSSLEWNNRRSVCRIRSCITSSLIQGYVWSHVTSKSSTNSIGGRNWEYLSQAISAS